MNPTFRQVLTAVTGLLLFTILLPLDVPSGRRWRLPLLLPSSPFTIQPGKEGAFDIPTQGERHVVRGYRGTVCVD